MACFMLTKINKPVPIYLLWSSRKHIEQGNRMNDFLPSPIHGRGRGQMSSNGLLSLSSALSRTRERA
ncbi:hypothetical protein GCM10027514_00100 [Azotobacter armeniacus]